jgi:dipeptidyl aminopeptidase/acylaminoacyl peptidase
MRTNNQLALKALMILLCLIFTLDIHAQHKKTLCPEDYPLWKSAPKIISAETSADGGWYAYKTGTDTLIQINVKNIKSGLQYNLKANITPEQHASYLYKPRTEFSKDGKWYAFTSRDTLCLLELNSGKKQFYTGINDIEFVGGQYLLGSKKNANDKSIWLKDLKNQAIMHIDRVSQFNINPMGTALAVIVNEHDSRRVKVITLKSGFPVSLITASNENDFVALTWNTTGNTLAFYETKSKQENNAVYKVHVCNDYALKPKLKSMDPKDNEHLPKDCTLKTSDELHLSPDGKQLFFYLTKNEVSQAKNNLNNKHGIEVWLPTDLSLPPGSENHWYDNLLWYQWRPEDNSIMCVTDGEYTGATLTGDAKKALVYNLKGYLPKYKYVNPFVDIYLKDLVTGTTKLLLKKVYYQQHQLYVSPAGRHIAYFKEKNWWAYDIQQDRHRCLTEGFKTVLENVEMEKVGAAQSYGSPGWFKNDSQLIIYDQNDIWLLSPDGKKKSKITNGAETNQTFRIAKSAVEFPPSPGPGEPSFVSHVYDGKKGFLINAVDNRNLDNALMFWTYRSGLKELVDRPMELSPFGKAVLNKPFLFEESDFNVPPRLMLYKPEGNAEMLYESDLHQKDFKWGKSELVHFTTPEGKRLKGALFYPADYVAGKRFPMVVNIYEKKSHLLHDYQVPSLSSDDSHNEVNITNFTTEGYFVFLPDISYEFNNPGISATRCVVAGVEKVIEMGLADRENIGLIGHSFGGYETAFIATQTDLFKTAVASAGITDMSSWAVLISQFGPNFTRIEEDQHRMNKEFLGEDYKRNSPMTYVHQMKTPILLWSGDKDTNVDVSQTMSFHTALWRLGKQSTMIIYKGENHVLMNPDNQIDVTHRVKNWFDHYLKGEKPAQWMVENIANKK